MERVYAFTLGELSVLIEHEANNCNTAVPVSSIHACSCFLVGYACLATETLVICGHYCAFAFCFRRLYGDNKLSLSEMVQ